MLEVNISSSLRELVGGAATITIEAATIRELLRKLVERYPRIESRLKEGIAVSKLELTEPKTNLMAGAYIIHLDISEIFAKNPNLKEDMFFDELIKKYYGAYDGNYKTRMMTKIKDISSKQWIRRAVKNILVNYKVAP